jgi:hypothetical protein
LDKFRVCRKSATVRPGKTINETCNIVIKWRKGWPANVVVKSALFGAPQTFSNTSTVTRSLSGIVVAKVALRGAPDSPAYTPPQQRGKAWLAMLLQAPSTVLHAHCTIASQISTAMGKSLSGRL